MSNELQQREDLFWNLADVMMLEGEAEEGTMMGFKCLRVQGKFFASLERKSKHLIVKLPKTRVLEMIETGGAKPFAPNGRIFKEWALIPKVERNVWDALLKEARDFVQSS